MKRFLSILLAGSIFIFMALNFNSCRKEFTLDEFDKLNNDSLHFEGSVAIPIVNTKLTLLNFIPPNDSSLWAEVDENDLVHLRMYYDDLVVIQMNSIYPNPPVLYPVDAGNVIPPYTHTIKTDTSKMKVYDKMLSGKLFFDNPSIKFYIENYIPVVTFFKMDTLTFYDFEENVLSHTDHTEYNIPAPSTIGMSEDTTIIIDSVAIPELADVFSPVPRFVSFDLSTGSHSIQTLPFAVTGEEELKVDVDIDLPLDARLDTIIMGDTIPFSFEGDTYEQIKSATLKIKLNNGFPIDGYSQIYFADTTDQGEIGMLVDSVFADIGENVTEDGWHLIPAETDSQGIVTFSHESEIIINLDQERINFLKNSHASKMIITGKLNSYNSDTGFFIKILSYYTMGVQIALKADFETSTEE